MPQSVARTRSRFFYGYWILLAGFIIQVIMNGVAYYGFSLFVKPLNAEFGWERGATMVGYTMMAIIGGAASPFIGRAVHKYGSRWILAAGALALGIGFALLSQTHSLWQFILSFGVVGIGCAGTGVVPTSMVISNWFNRRRGFAIGVVGTGIGVGGFILPVILGGYVIPDHGWRAGYLVSGILSAAILVPLSLWLIRERPEDMGQSPDNDVTVHTGDKAQPMESGLSVNQAVRTRQFWLMAAAFFIFSVASGQIFQNHAPHLQDIGFPAATAAMAVGIVGIGSAVGKFGFGWLCDFVPPKYIIIIGCVLQAGATLALMRVNPESSTTVLWLYAILLGLSIGCWFPGLSMTTSTTFGLVAYGVIFGIYNFIWQMGNASGPWLGGFIFDRTNGYDIGFILSFVFYAFVVPCMLLVRKAGEKA